MEITKMLSNNHDNHYEGVNNCNYITIHETGNTSAGSTAVNHANFINNGAETSWHYTVDDHMIVQHYEDSVQCWHCGDGLGDGNSNSIGIEMCVNSDGDLMKTVNNTIDLVKQLMQTHNIPIENVVQHYYWIGKNCPQNMRAGIPISWGEFINIISESYQNNSPQPQQPTNNNPLYVVQVGAFHVKQNALNMQDELLKLGFGSFITIK